MRGYPPRCVTSKSVCLDEFCDACQGRVETVLDYFQSCQTDEWWEQLNISHVCQVELSPRISSIYENVRNCKDLISQHSQWASNHVVLVKTSLNGAENEKCAAE